MLKKILVVDDVLINRLILNELFANEYDVIEAENGLEALNLLEENKDEVVIILLDLIMPVMDGFEVLRRLNETGVIKKIPVILITGEDDDEKTLLGFNYGVSDFIRKPFNPDIVQRRVDNVIDLYSYKNHLERRVDEQKRILEKQTERIKNTNLFLIDALSTTVEFRSLESGEHIKRMRNLVILLLEAAREYYYLTEDQVDVIAKASALHDIGKVSIPDAVLQKPGRLTTEEFEIMKTHTVRGCEILDNMQYFDDPEFFKYCYEICRYHHERWDGRGYPDKLSGDAIPIWAQAVSIADVYDALTSKRVYKDAYPHDVAIKMIVNNECGVFNPKLISSLLKIEDKLRKFSEHN